MTDSYRKPAIRRAQTLAQVAAVPAPPPQLKSISGKFTKNV